MSLTKKLSLEAIFFVIIGAMTGAVVVQQTNKPQHTLSNLSVVAATPTATLTPIPSFAPSVTTSSQISSDGSKKVTVKETEQQNHTKVYDIESSDGDGNNQQHITSETLGVKETLTIPFNTWSPNNKYFFLQEDTTVGPLVKVFNGNGEPFANEETNLDLTGTFKDHATGNNFGEATGWAADNLIIINTTLADTTKGPSYWFEVPSKGILYLSTQF